MTSTRRVAAEVFLRGPSGRSLRHLGADPPPDDLTPFIAPHSRRDAAIRTLEKAGFRVHAAPSGCTLSIDATPAIFARVFNLDVTQVHGSAARSVDIAVPAALADMVDAIVLIPQPEFFG